MKGVQGNAGKCPLGVCIPGHRSSARESLPTGSSLFSPARPSFSEPCASSKGAFPALQVPFPATWERGNPKAALENSLCAVPLPLGSACVQEKLGCGWKILTFSFKCSSIWDGAVKNEIWSEERELCPQAWQLFPKACQELLGILASGVFLSSI